MECNYLQKKIVVRQKQYQIDRQVGAGSHATIWLARATFYPHEEIIVKIARDKQGVSHERIQNEIFFLKEITHPHIPTLLDHGTLEQSLWLAMPLFEEMQISFSAKGKLVKVAVSDTKPEGYPKKAPKIPLGVREKTAIAVLTDLSRVIAYLAGTGIIHADISPGNIMEKKGSVMTKQYVLTDWGATALIYRYPAEAFGSLHFTAPERLRGEVGIKSDLFSLGVVAFYILTGTVPFKGMSGEEYYLTAVQCDEICPSEVQPGIVAPLDKLIRDMIRYKPENRPEPEDVCKRIEKIRG